MTIHRFPTFLGIGAQKCATTWIAHALKGHPDVYVVPAKEIDFWSHHYHMGFSWYLDQFREADALQFGEVSPSYLVSAEAPARLARHAPHTKLILALRDPVDRAFSNHLHQLRKGDYKGEDPCFEAGLADNPMYVEQSCYGRHLARWRDFFPGEQILVLFQEEIDRDKRGQAERIYAFLGVRIDWFDAHIMERQHESVGYRHAGLAQTLRFLGRSGRQVGLTPMVKQAKRMPGLGTLYQQNRRDLREEIPRPDGPLRSRLAAGFADDMKLLSELLGRPHLPWPSWEYVKG